jgi:hypothetical protein
VLPTPPGAMGNPLMGLPVMVRCKSVGPPRAGPMMMAPEPPSSGERLRPPNRSVMNSRLTKWMVLPWGKPTHGEFSSPVTETIVDDGTIRTA